MRSPEGVEAEIVTDGVDALRALGWELVEQAPKVHSKAPAKKQAAKPAEK
mgnify:FL=1